MKAYIRRDVLAVEVSSLIERLNKVNSSLTSLDRDIERITNSIGRSSLQYEISKLEKQLERISFSALRQSYPGMAEAEAIERVERANANIQAELKPLQERLAEWENENLPKLEQLELSKNQRLEERRQLEEQLSLYVEIEVREL